MVVRGHQDLDTNIVRWGLHHLLDGDACVHRPQSLTTDYAPPPLQPHRASALLDAPALAEVMVDAVNNDEVIVHALQEDLTHVVMAEASETAGAELHRRGTVLTQQWFRPEVVTHLPSAPPYVEEAEGFSPCSSPEEGGNARDGQGCSIEIVDDFSALDGEVIKRLKGMLPVPIIRIMLGIFLKDAGQADTTYSRDHMLNADNVVDL
ncbi:uncharacterized protein LOC123405232 [Hordeum vulgare subsp. vulgare]|uniref:uncharacterized protein LOC123405232 n=1 Tax=Hordeum vulgare subsp. vulgare TaxID=112509 RepID=UPI001D1A5020|nr:uncharacterized protein LOC123405232 [Hordeum vulgare subsp. vulgare]